MKTKDINCSNPFRVIGIKLYFYDIFSSYHSDEYRVPDSNDNRITVMRLAIWLLDVASDEWEGGVSIWN
jgi:hypothetical protein